MKAFRIFSIALLLLLSTQSIFAGRYYDSKTGRFLSVDPKADKFPGLSSYNYALNNPLRNIDPDGKAPGDAIINVGIGLGTFFSNLFESAKESLEYGRNARFTASKSTNFREVGLYELVTNADIKWSKGITNSLESIEDKSNKVSLAAGVVTPIVSAINPGAGAATLKVGATASAVSTLSGMGAEGMKGNTNKLLTKMTLGAASFYGGQSLNTYMGKIDPKNAKLLEQTFTPLLELSTYGIEKVIEQVDNTNK